MSLNKWLSVVFEMVLACDDGCCKDDGDKMRMRLAHDELDRHGYDVIMLEPVVTIIIGLDFNNVSNGDVTGEVNTTHCVFITELMEYIKQQLNILSL